MATPPPVVNLTEVVNSSLASTFSWLIPTVIVIAVIFGVLGALLRRFERRMRRKERIEDQLAYEEELEHARRMRGKRR